MKKPIHPLRLTGVCLAAILMLCSCSPSQQPTDADGLLDISVTDMNNEQVRPADYKGRVIMYNLWASWCQPCRNEIPDFIELQEQFGNDGLVILGVSLDKDSLDTVRRFADRHKMNYPVFYAGDQGETIIKKIGNFRGIPTTLVIDREGQIVGRIVGAAPKREWVKTLKKLL